MKMSFCSFIVQPIKQTQKILLALVGLMLLSQSNAYAVEKLPQYQVEVIVYETTALRGWTEETWPLIETDLDLEGSVPADSLPEDKFMLGDVANKLKPEVGYNILVHQAYAIYGEPEDKATRISIETFPESEWTSKVKGTLFFYKSKYPHVDVEFQIDKAIPSRVREDFAKQQKIEINYEAGEAPPKWRFDFKESRKILNDELHYIDHPIFGVLVKIKAIAS